MERVKVSKLLVDKGFDINAYRLDPRDLEGRCEGKTTGLAYSLIGHALFNPGEEILVRDHINNHSLNHSLLAEIRGIVRASGLKYLTIADSSCSIRFDLPYATYEKRWVEVNGS